MKKWQKNPWCVAPCAKPYQVIVENLNGSPNFEESRGFRRFEDAKEYYSRVNARKDRFVRFGVLNRKDGDVDLCHNFDSSDQNATKSFVNWVATNLK